MSLKFEANENKIIIMEAAVWRFYVARVRQPTKYYETLFVWRTGHSVHFKTDLKINQTDFMILWSLVSVRYEISLPF